ncbi:MAG: hypothetical protein NDJ90_10975 [Oligoflexia bacterium]|nr:hypothetical protein [Oligoflexia bacterium]
MQQLVILDFDGTMTNAEEEGQPFRAGYLEDLAALTGRPLPEISAMAERFEAEVLADPQSYGWLWNGNIVAPATVDPYLRVMPVARKILDECQSILDEQDRARLLDGILFKYNYRKTVRAFRPHAAEALASLKDFSTWVVTNAHVEPVKAKIAELEEQLSDTDSLSWLLPQVIGRAQKQEVDDAATHLPREIAVPGLKRPVLVRRPQYHTLLERLRGDRPWANVTVVGDIFELDLSLPLVLGARVILAANDFTPEYERAFVASHPRGRVIEDLRDIPRAILHE